jgi:predicted nucleic acid-binding protein
MNYLDSSVIVAALLAGQSFHEESLHLVLTQPGAVSVHGLLETFATLTGGKLGFRIDADVVARLLDETIRPRVTVIDLCENEVRSSFAEAKSRGVRGGAIYDFIHLVAARQAGADRIYTLNLSDFVAVRRPGDPEIGVPPSPF